MPDKKNKTRQDKIRQGIILAAGFGRRLRPHTADTPKPLVKVHGRPILESPLDLLEESGVSDIAVNTHYKAGMISDYLADRSHSTRIMISHEKEILDTGGGIKKAAALLDRGDPFFVLSGDSILIPGSFGNPLIRMAAQWDPAAMDIMILLMPVENMTLTKGVGDYGISDTGVPVRKEDKSGAYMWTSARICRPRILKDTHDGPFSFLPLLDEAEQSGRLAALVHDGDWYHISTPADLKRVNSTASKTAINA